MNPAVDADVAIVGYGPVGNTLAILLAQLGRTVVVLERHPRPYPLPRAVHFDDEVGRILQSCGIGPALRAISEPADVYEWRNGSGTVLLRFGRSRDSGSGWPLSSMFNQPALEALLDKRTRELAAVVVRRSFAVAAIDQRGDHVVVRAEDGTEVRACYAVGCDGANSTVRALAGAPMCDLGFFYDWLVVDVILDQPRLFDPLNVQICDPTRPTTAVSGGPGRRRWEFMRLPHETLEELNSGARAWELLAPWDVHPGNARLERHCVYTFGARYAEQWRAGRVLLAGDAAHLMPPFAGQGMCAGIRDAANLAWKLDHVLRGASAEGLLDTYQAERMPSVRQAIEFSMGLGKVICVPDPVEAAARDQAMAAAVGPEPAEVPPLPPLESGLVHPGAPHAGDLFVQGCVRGRLFDDVHGAGWRLVTVDLDVRAVDPATVAWFEGIGGRVVALREPDAVYRRWFSDHEATTVLQRPDFYLYGCATGAEGATALLEDLRRHLSTDHSLQGAAT
ncbi:MAG: bifunctional 3-(3-hydroxy-phenyl)propionate/3-hydroxycinnamic acid hydroxylase [Acidimicrobiia bacterium]|nr:bifunctional 3-(3-hydroxy-phenyl)propionate/3-hydroxycinnamic acid hydroxylase [Acidimicrobiia bacterium]